MTFNLSINSFYGFVIFSQIIIIFVHLLILQNIILTIQLLLYVTIFRNLNQQHTVVIFTKILVIAKRCFERYIENVFSISQQKMESVVFATDNQFS